MPRTPALTWAETTALDAHLGQLRKGSGEPYIEHPRRIAEASMECCLGEVAACTAWLHDVLEDTYLGTDKETTLSEIEQHCGADVATGVAALTEPDSSQGNRETRQALFLAQLQAAPLWAQGVKALDRADNLSSIATDDPEFYLTYRDESLKLLEALKAAPEAALKRLAQALELTPTPVDATAVSEQRRTDPLRVMGHAEQLMDSQKQPYLGLKLRGHKIQDAAPKFDSADPDAPNSKDGRERLRIRNHSGRPHLTLLSAKEYGILNKDPKRRFRIQKDLLKHDFEIHLDGIYQVSDPKRPGRAATGIAVSNPWLNTWRVAQGLSARDFHITMGIGLLGDVHDPAIRKLPQDQTEAPRP